MTYTTAISPPVGLQDSRSGLNATLSTCLLALLLLALCLSGCKSASTPTQTQSQALPQSSSQVKQNPSSSTPSDNTPSNHGRPARSDAEIIGDFDAELDASIAVFDGMIVQERRKAEAIEASIGGNDGGATDGAGGSGGDGELFEDGDIYEGLPGYGEFPEEGTADEGDAQQAGSTASADIDSPAAEGGASSTSGPQTHQRGGIPEDIQSGSDDDIVARQIREAALQEKDPLLREKLWDEYRKYKNQR
ncbi:hypothetical protein A9Q89_09945 [Gammaproteobacteria bacterium 53_120_T64]|nr:hypothetical protein A9Q89_09945 [Gammaproteobacteria bacterium 53_120_T64]